jgi:hypothetical protein
MERAMRADRRVRIGAMVGAMLVAFLAAQTAAGWPAPSWTLAFWLAACLAGELLWVRLPGWGTTISMASCFDYAALLVLPTGHAMAVAGLAAGLGEGVAMRKRPERAIYNAAQTALAVAAGSLVFRALAGGSHDLVGLLSEMRLLALAAPAVVFYLANRSAVVLAVWVSEGVPPLEAWRRDFGNGYELLSSGAVLSLGALLAVHYAGIGPSGTLLVALPLVLAADGLRRHTRRRAAEEAAEPPSERRAA